jgi:N-acetylmuramoyl-L-alanine amidase
MNRSALAAVALAASMLAACAPLPERSDPNWRPSPNFDERRPNFVIIHATSNDTAAQALRTLTSAEARVSAHYLVDRDGTVYRLVAETARAWHAGESKWGADTDLNSVSLGIELDNNGREPFADAQIAALLTLLQGIRSRYPGIPAANYIGHADVAPRRKVDPSRYFPWEILAREGFGLWCEPPLPMPSATMDTTVSLRALGYDLADRMAAIRAFRRHFLKEDSAAEFDDRARSVLACLLEKSSGAP